MSKTKTKPARLIVAASEQDPDMLYATKFGRPIHSFSFSATANGHWS